MVSLQESRPLSRDEAFHLAWLQKRHDPVLTPTPQQSDSGGIEELLADLTMEDLEGSETEQDVIEALSESDIAVDAPKRRLVPLLHPNGRLAGIAEEYADESGNVVPGSRKVLVRTNDAAVLSLKTEHETSRAFEATSDWDFLVDLTPDDTTEVIEALSEGDIAVVETVEAITAPAPTPSAHQEPDRHPTSSHGAFQSEPAMADFTLEEYERLVSGEPDPLRGGFASSGGDGSVSDMLADLEAITGELPGDNAPDQPSSSTEFCAPAEEPSMEVTGRVEERSTKVTQIVEYTEEEINELLASLDGTPSKNVSDPKAEPRKIVSSPSKAVSEPTERPSKNVSDLDDGLSKPVSPDPSKFVSQNKHQSLQNDRKTIAKMRSFRLSDLSAVRTSSVSYTPLKATAPPTPVNDNLIPVWSRTGELVTAVCAAAALQIDDNPAIAFTFNLTPGAITGAISHPEDFLDSLKRSFDQNLRRAGITLPYFFAVDIDDDGRLHLHGAFRYPAPKASISMTRRIRTVMKNSWGEWVGPGKHKQLHFQRLRDDEWATYCMRNSEAVQKVIGPRSFTITHSLGREAKWAYSEIRSILRGEK